MEELLNKIRKFRNDRDWDQYHSPKNLAMALVVEAAELAEKFQWLTEEQSFDLPREKLAEVKDEVGDVLIYLLNLCDKLGIEPVEAAGTKLQKNEEKYPAETVRGRSDKYNEYK